MTIPIPKEPSGQHPLAQWCRDVVRCLRMLQPRPGVDTFTNVTTHGTTRSAKPQRGGGGQGGGPAYYA